MPNLPSEILVNRFYYYLGKDSGLIFKPRSVLRRSIVGDLFYSTSRSVRFGVITNEVELSGGLVPNVVVRGLRRAAYEDSDLFSQFVREFFGGEESQFI